MENRNTYKLKEFILALREQYQQNNSLELISHEGILDINLPSGSIKSSFNQENNSLEIYINETKEDGVKANIIFYLQDDRMEIKSSNKELSNEYIVKILNTEIMEEKLNPNHLYIINVNPIIGKDIILERINPSNNVSFYIENKNDYISLSTKKGI